MKFREALIAWNPGTDQIEIGPLLSSDGEPDWTAPYGCTGGAAFIRNRNVKGAEAQIRALKYFVDLVLIFNMDPRAARTALMGIDEFRQAMRENNLNDQ